MPILPSLTSHHTTNYWRHGLQFPNSLEHSYRLFGLRPNNILYESAQSNIENFPKWPNLMPCISCLSRNLGELYMDHPWLLHMLVMGAQWSSTPILTHSSSSLHNNDDSYNKSPLPTCNSAGRSSPLTHAVSTLFVFYHTSMLVFHDMAGLFKSFWNLLVDVLLFWQIVSAYIRQLY